MQYYRNYNAVPDFFVDVKQLSNNPYRYWKFDKCFDLLPVI